MKKVIKILLLICLVAAIMPVTSCSRKGVHMSKHRKSRKCNCPTFANESSNTVMFAINDRN